MSFKEWRCSFGSKSWLYLRFQLILIYEALANFDTTQGCQFPVSRTQEKTRKRHLILNLFLISFFIIKLLWFPAAIKIWISSQSPNSTTNWVLECYLRRLFLIDCFCEMRFWNWSWRLKSSFFENRLRNLMLLSDHIDSNVVFCGSKILICRLGGDEVLIQSRRTQFGVFDLVWVVCYNLSHSSLLWIWISISTSRWLMRSQKLICSSERFCPCIDLWSLLF